jgi:ABC-type sugar transport system substrate-binding protein
MRHRAYIFFGLFLAVGLFLFFLFGSELGKNGDEKEYRIGYILPKLNSAFWIEYDNIIKEYSKFENIDIAGFSPRLETEEYYANSVNLMISQEFDAILFGGNAHTDLYGPIINHFESKGVPIFSFDVKLELANINGYVKIDNYDSAKLAGEYIFKNTKKDGNVLIIYPNDVHASSVERYGGIKDYFDEVGASYLPMNVNDMYWDVQNVYDISREELMKNNISAIFAVWDDALLTARNVANELNKTDLIYVGFDGNLKALEKINEGYITATIAQPKKEIIEAAFNMIISHLEGRRYDNELEILGDLVTAENVDEYLM